MAKPALAVITTSQTFQNWLDKTNEMVGIFRTSAITASLGGDTTEGDATLLGIFTSTEVVAASVLKSDDIAARSASGTITFQSPVELIGTSQIVATFNYGASGARTRYTNGSLSWDMGIENNSTGNFIIDTGVSPTKFQLSTAGTLTVPNIVVLEKIVADEFEKADGTPIGVSILNELIDVTIADPTTGQVLKYNGTKWANGVSALNELSDIAIGAFPQSGQVLKYNGTAWVNGTDSIITVLSGLSDVTIASPSSGQVLKYNGTAWVNGTDAAGSTDASTLDSLDSTQFLRSDVDDTASGNYIFSGILQVAEIRSTGDVITNYSASDIALKENLQIINNSLDKVSQINGYTFNYIDRPEERITGVIAQEIEKVLPEVVFDHERNNGTYKAVRYDNIIPLLIEAIKELKGKVDDLETRLNSSGN